jgi:YegS/Rv2252/BmrU family lipid kinase
VRAFHAQGWSVEVARTLRPGHAAELAAAAVQAGARHIIAVGGDGTVHEAANGLLACGGTAALGVIPVGTGNDFAKLVGVHGHNPARAVARLVTAPIRKFDVGRVREEYFVNSMGFGFGPEVLRVRGESARLPGRLSYFVPVPKAFWGFRAPRCEVGASEHREAGYMMMIEVCNGTTAGGMYRFAPDADPTDGYLDVCLIRRVSLARFLIALPLVLRGRHRSLKEVALFQTRELTVRTPDAPLVMHLDGELRFPEARECTVTAVPGRLNVLAPA